LKQYDIVIIGAGIHGAGCAQAAAAAGFNCLVLEQYSKPAQGTSSRSSKLIHGGLRYLEGGYFGLVRESLREQALLLKNAPELVHRVPFYLPVYKGGHRPAWMIRAGLMFYKLLGGQNFKNIHRDQWQNLDGLKTEGLKQVFQYWDAQTDDALLTKAVLVSAQQMGAEVATSACFGSARRAGDGYIINYMRAETCHKVQAKILINASGPWVNQVLAVIHPKPPQLSVDLVAGTHIVLPAQLDKGIYYLESLTDQRAVFVMPWKDHILMGTTETLYTGDPASITSTDHEINYLLDIYNNYFKCKLTRNDVLESFAGLRVLPAQKDSPFKRSRETIFFPDHEQEPKLFTIYGGKLTTYRATSECLINKIIPLLPRRTSKADTHELHLSYPR
jgi:glycerol-3-phosphate dehydrogenase